MSDEVPNHTLRVLENIQAELVGLRADGLETRRELKAELHGLRGEVHELRGEVHELRGETRELRSELKILNERFDHFLKFVGKDVQELKMRMAAVEEQLRSGHR